MAKATVTAVVSPADGTRDTVLLTKRTISPFKGAWCLPGGHIDSYESVSDAVGREVFEETGLVFTPSGSLGWFEEIFPSEEFHAIVIAFFGTGTGSLLPQPEEVAEIAWVPLEKALGMQLAFNHNNVLRRYAEQIGR